MAEKSYKVPRAVQVLHLVLFGFLLVIGLGLALPAALSAERTSNAPFWFVAAWLALLAWYIYQGLTTAVEVRVRGDGSVEFLGALKRVSMEPRAIRSVKGGLLTIYLITVVYDRGKIRLLTPIDGLHEFLSWLKQANPQVEIKWL